MEESLYLHCMFKDYQKGVHDLASKLPQWNSSDLERRYYSAMSSLFEEAGELAGICSKMRSRSKQYGMEPRKQDNFNDAKQKFIDEASDFLWVLVCSCYSIHSEPIDIDFLKYIKGAKSDINSLDLNLEQSLYYVLSSINAMNSAYLFYEEKETKMIAVDLLKYCLSDIIYSFGLFLAVLNSEYDINLTVLMQHNQAKLSTRYNDKGVRIDGK